MNAPLLVIGSLHSKKKPFSVFFLTLSRGLLSMHTWFQMCLTCFLQLYLFTHGRCHFNYYFAPFNTTQLTGAPWNYTKGCAAHHQNDRKECSFSTEGGFHPPVFMRIFNLSIENVSRNAKNSKKKSFVFTLDRGGQVGLEIKAKCDKVQWKQL